MIRQQLPAYSPISAKAVVDAWMQLASLGPDPRSALRALLAEEYDASTVILCGSGTQALTLAIREARVRVHPKAPVALPAFSCFDVASAAVGAGARVVLYDLDPNTLGPDMESLERVLRAGSGVVVIAPLYGIPVEWDTVEELAIRYGSVLIEDAAQGHGASWNGKQLGSVGKISVLSFGRGKGWTGGRGGALLMRGTSPSAGEQIPTGGLSSGPAVALRVLAQWGLARPAIYGLPVSIPALKLGQTTYVAPRPSTAITRSAAATLVGTYQKAISEAGTRQKNASRLIAAFAENPQVRMFPQQAHGCAGYLRLPVSFPDGMAEFESPQKAVRLGVSPGYPLCLSELPQLAASLLKPARAYPGAQTLVRQLVTVPTHSRLHRRDLSDIIEIFSRV